MRYASVGAFKGLIHFVCCHLLASFLQRQQEDQHLQRCKQREMVRAAVHIYWGRRHWAWAWPPLCSRRRGKAASEQNAWRHSDKCLACSVAVLCCFTAGRKV
jgi:hypothetical protein